MMLEEFGRMKLVDHDDYKNQLPLGTNEALEPLK